MRIRVSDVFQTGGPGWVVKYWADIATTTANTAVFVEITSTFPLNADPVYVKQAAEAIQRGAETALSALGMGATIRVEELCIHDVDFLVSRFEKATAEQMSRALANT